MSEIAEEEAQGAAVERTVLSWNRAAIVLGANGVLLVRAGVVHDLPLLDVLGGAVALLALVVWALSLLRYSALAGQKIGHLFGGRAGSARPVAVFIVALSLLELGVVAYLR
jgi:uncharacterized membrane protein YidH (DUF202 family)